jgi:hypothetical protein
VILPRLNGFDKEEAWTDYFRRRSSPKNHPGSNRITLRREATVLPHAYAAVLDNESHPMLMQMKTQTSLLHKDRLI